MTRFWSGLRSPKCLDRSEETDTAQERVATEAPLQSGQQAHKQLVQTKLNQILSTGSDSDDDRPRDLLEEVSVEQNQAVACFGRAIYEVYFKLDIRPVSCLRSLVSPYG